MSPKIFAPLIGLLVCACATTGPSRTERSRIAFEASFQSSVAECRSKYPNQYEKPVTPRVACLQDAVTAYNTRLATLDASTPVELQKIRSARFKDLARQYDEGTITREEYDAALQRTDAEYNKAVNARTQ